VPTFLTHNSYCHISHGFHVHLCRVVMSAMHVVMFKMVQTVKQNVPALRTPTLLRYVVLVIPTASVTVRGQQTDLARMVVIRVRLWFLNQTLHTA